VWCHLEFAQAALDASHYCGVLIFGDTQVGADLVIGYAPQVGTEAEAGTRGQAGVDEEVVNVDGKIGVLVKCPSTESLSIGDVIKVTGVVEGSVPEGWTANRRYIRARTADDVVRISP